MLSFSVFSNLRPSLLIEILLFRFSFRIENLLSFTKFVYGRTGLYSEPVYLVFIFGSRLRILNETLFFFEGRVARESFFISCWWGKEK